MIKVTSQTFVLEIDYFRIIVIVNDTNFDNYKVQDA